MDADHKRLLLHTEVRWLSKGKALTRVFELREELQKFLSNKQSPLAAHFSDKSWLAKLAYLSDIFMTLNDLNLTMQGRMADTFRLADKIAGFKAKLETWARRVNRGVFDMFTNLSSFSEDAEGLGQLIHCHLTSLSDEFERYFPSEKDPRNGKVWMRYPFHGKYMHITYSYITPLPKVYFLFNFQFGKIVISVNADFSNNNRLLFIFNYFKYIILTAVDALFLEQRAENDNYQ